jgi:hypothetical protein
MLATACLDSLLMKTHLKKWCHPVAILSLATVVSVQAIPPPIHPPINTAYVVISWSLTPSDLGSNGQYSVGFLSTNNPNIGAINYVTNVPSGTTNVWIPITILPSNPCTAYCIYSQAGVTSFPAGPVIVDTNQLFSWQPAPVSGLSASPK